MNSQVVKVGDSIVLKGMMRAIGTKVGTGEVMQDTGWCPNMVMLGTYLGKGLILARLAGDLTYTCVLNWLTIGSSSTAPTASDTQLGAEVTRGSCVNQIISTNVLTIQAFIPDAQLANGSYPEAGSVVDGSASVNTGKQFNHILFTIPYVKASGQDTTLQLQLTIN